MLRTSLAHIVRKNRRSAPFRLIARAAQKYLQLWTNADFWDFERNGEAFVLRSFAAWSGAKPVQIWDVGAHFGEWAVECRRFVPSASIVSFEIVPEIALELEKTAEHIPWLTVVRCGLSDSEGVAKVLVSPDFSTTNAINPRVGHVYVTDISHYVECPIMTGDTYLANAGTPIPMFLKIDTEGHEHFVLSGCRDMLAHHNAPAIIQFEYGDTYIPSGSTRQKVQEFLKEFGYSVGRLFPAHVEFGEYCVADDDFKMGNLIAVKDEKLREMLSG